MPSAAPSGLAHPPRIDVHAHFYPLMSRKEAASLGLGQTTPWLRDNGDGTGHMMVGEHEYRPVQAPLWDPAARIAEMDRHGVAVQVMSATPMLFAYAAEPKRALRWSAWINDLAAAMAETDAARLRTLCQVPLQDVDAACREVRRAREAGHVGVHIGNHVCGRNLDDPELVRFLRYCADEGMAVLVHPWDMMAGERMVKYMLKWLVGMPAETHLAILSLILSGAFERLPSHLRICFTHGGDNFAQQLGRVDNAWRRRDIVRADCPNPPSSYVDRFSVDSAVFDDDTLAFLVGVMGEDRVMLGSDYPFPLGELEPGELVAGSSKLSAEAKAKVAGGNAARFFGLEPLPGSVE